MAGFIDDTVTRITRPGGGPAEEGINAERYNTLIQQAFLMVTKLVMVSSIKQQSFQMECVVNCTDLSLLGDDDYDDDDDDDDAYTDTYSYDD